MSNNSLWNRLFGISKKRRTANHLDRFSEQFDTKLNFRELEPRMVLSGATDSDTFVDTNLSLVIDLDDGESAIVTAEALGMGLNAKITVSIDGNETYFQGEKVMGQFQGISNLESITLTGTGVNGGTTSVVLDSSLNIADLEGNALALNTFSIDGIDSTTINAKLSTSTFTITNPLANNDELSVTQGMGTGITVSTDLTVTNSSSESIKINLSESGNDFNTVSATGGLTGDEITIADANDIVLGDIEANQLSISADADNADNDGEITQKVATTIKVSGTSDFTSGDAKDVTLTNANEFTGAVSVVGQSAASGAVMISNEMALLTGNINAGALTLTAKGNISQANGAMADATSATFVFSSAAATLDFDNTENTFGTVTVTNASNLENFLLLNDHAAAAIPTGMPFSDQLKSGDMENVSLIFENSGDLALPDMKITGDLIVQSGGHISQVAMTTLEINAMGKTASFTSGSNNNITLENAGNDFNIISAMGGSPAMAVSISDTGDIVLGKIEATTLTVTADSDKSGTDGTITQKGATTISATSTANFTSGNGKAVTLTNANEFQGAVTVNGQTAASGAVSITDLTDLELGAISAASLVAIADSNDSQDDGMITQNGATTISSGASSFTSGNAKVVTLINANDFTGPVSVEGQSAASDVVSITDTTDLELGTINAASLIVSADSDDSATDGAITQDGVTTITSGDAGFTSGNAKAVTLTNMNEFAGVVSVAGQSDESGIVEISDVSAIALGDITAASLTVIADGAITDADGSTIAVTNTAKFSGDSITLGDKGGDSTNFGMLNFISDGNVTIQEDSDTDITGTNTANKLTLDSTGSIEDNDLATTNIDVKAAAELTVATFITLGGKNSDVTNFGTLNFTAGAGDTVTIQEDSTTNLEGTNTAGNLVLESAGSIIENSSATIELTQPLFGSTTTGDAKFIVGADDLNMMNKNLVIDLFENNIIRAAEFSAQDVTDTIKTLMFKNVYNDDDLAGNNENKFTEATSPVLPAVLLETLDIEYTHAPLTIESVAVGNILTDGSIRIVSGDGVLTESADKTVVEDTFINDITNAVITGTPVGKTVTGEFESDRWIQLANDGVLESIDINGDVSFKSNLGYLIEVGTTITVDPTAPTPMTASRGTDSGATVNLGAVNFNTQSASLLGHVMIVEDSDMEVYGGNTADSLFLHSPLNNISDRDGTEIDVDGLAVFIADNNITLANHKNDELDVTGNTTFYTSGILDAIDVGVSPVANPLDAARGIDSKATVELGSVHFTAANVGLDNADPTLDIGKVTIFDDTDSVLNNANSLKFNLLPFNNFFMRSLVFNSGMSLTDASDTDISTFGTQAFTHFSAATTIGLADNSADSISTLGNAFFESTTGQAIDVGVTPTTQLAAARGTDSGATVEFGNLTFSSQNGTNGDVTIREDFSTQIAHTHLDDSNKADSLVLVSAGDITDAAKVASNTATIINVTSFAEFNAAINIVLADNANDQLTVGGNALFSSASSEFFATPALDHRINVGVTDLDTTTMPTDVTRGTDSKATVLLGSVTFRGAEPDGMGKTDTHVTIREDHDMELANSTRSGHDNKAETGFLVTSGTLTDANGTDVTLEDFGVMIAGSSITLANNKNDSISIANNATFGTFTGAVVDIGVIPATQLAVPRGTDSKAKVNFGSLHYTSNANSADVTIYEDSNTLFDRGEFALFETLDLTSYFAKSSSVTSEGTIIDSKGTVFNNTAFAEFIAKGVDAGTNQSITLADSKTDTMSIAGNALFESTKGGDIEVGVLPTATAGALIDETPTRGDDAGDHKLFTVNFGSLTTNTNSSFSNVTVREDGDMKLSNSIRLDQSIDAGSLFFVASNSEDISDETKVGTAAITDAIGTTGTSINSVNLAVFRTDDSITLADNKGDMLTVGGNATFYTTELVSIDVGVIPQTDPLDINRGQNSAKVDEINVTFDSVHFSTETLLPALNTGGVTIYEDNDSLFDNTNQVFDLISFGDHYARSIVFSSAGSITDAEDTSIDTSDGINAADSFAHFSADNQITLADKFGDFISILGNAFFESKTGQEIHVGVDPMKAVDALDRGTDSNPLDNVLPPDVTFGTLTVASSGKDGHVTINEDEATVFADARSFNIHNGNTSIAESLTLHSDGSITDAVSMTDFVVRDLAHFEARTGAVEFDLVLGDKLGVNNVDLSELFFIADDVSIVEQSDIMSADDQAVYIYDGSTANGQIAIQTSGHLIQVNDARPGAVEESISATTGLFHAKGAVVLTNIEFNTLAAHAENTVMVEHDKTLNDTDSKVMVNSLTTDKLPSFLPTSDTDTFAPPAPDPTNGGANVATGSEINLTGDYSMVLEHHGNLIIDALTDAAGGGLGKLNGLKTEGDFAGHIFLETLNNGTDGDLTFGSIGAAVDIDNQKVFTALAAGELTIDPPVSKADPGAKLVSHVNDPASKLVELGFPGAQPFLPELTTSIGPEGIVTTITEYPDINPVASKSEGPTYEVNAHSFDIVQAKSLPIGYSVDIKVDKVGELVEKNNRVEIIWDDGQTDVWLFEDGIKAADMTTFNHFYQDNFPGNNENKALVTVNAYNDPLINLFDGVISSAKIEAEGLTGAKDLNFVTDVIQVVFDPPVEVPPLPAPFVKPLSPIYEYPAVADLRSDVVANLVEFSEGPTILLQIQEVSARKYNEVTMNYGERETLTEKNLFSLEQVKEHIYETPSFLPGEYEISILLAGQQEPLIAKYIKPDPSSFDSSFPDRSSNHSLEYLKQLACSQEIERSTETAEQVWEQQYEQWFPTVVIEQIDDNSAAFDSKANSEGLDSTDPISGYVEGLLLESAPEAQLAVLNADNDLKLGESWKSRNRTDLALGMGGAMIMGAYAINTQAQNDRRDAVEETLSSEKTKIKFSKRTRLRERLKRIF